MFNQQNDQQKVQLIVYFNCEIVHVTHSPRLVGVKEIEQIHPRTAKRLKKGGVHQVVRATNLVVFAMSKESGSAAYNHTVLEDVMSILKTGRLSDGSRAEAFINQTRIPGGERDDRK